MGSCLPARGVAGGKTRSYVERETGPADKKSRNSRETADQMQGQRRQLGPIALLFTRFASN